MNNLNELNEILFDTLKKVQAGEFDEKKAGAVVQLSNSIINNGKLQLSAYKFANSGKAPEMFGLPEKPKDKPLQISDKKKLDRHQGMLKCAQEYGHRSVADAIAKEGKKEFELMYKEWLQDEI